MKKQDKIHIYGRHAVSEALKYAPHILRKVFIAQEMQDTKLRQLVRASSVPTEPLDARRATSQVEGGVSHQGIIALISLKGLMTPFEKFLDTLTVSPETSLIFLDEIQDPHNVGTIIRSAAAFGARAVLLPIHNQAGVSGGVIKASAGMAFKVPLIEVENTQAALAALKKKGFRIHGFAASGRQTLAEEPFTEAAVFVFGNEAQGVTPSARALCDTMLSVPINPRCESLNVAATCAVALSTWSLKHPEALRAK